MHIAVPAENGVNRIATKGEKILLITEKTPKNITDYPNKKYLSSTSMDQYHLIFFYKYNTKRGYWNRFAERMKISTKQPTFSYTLREMSEMLKQEPSSWLD